MQSKAVTVEGYLAQLPADRRAAIEAVRQIILKNLDKDYEEGMQYGMIGYYVPHHVYPAGYHCDPRQPLLFAGLASQKNYMSLYLMLDVIGEAIKRVPVKKYIAHFEGMLASRKSPSKGTSKKSKAPKAKRK
jgi:hypothetical protein